MEPSPEIDPCLPDRLVCAPAWPVAIAVLREVWIEDWREHLQQRLLDHASSTVGIPSRRFPPPGFGISTRRTGWGRYCPCRSSVRMRAQ
jgi:hypothetical protein